MKAGIRYFRLWQPRSVARWLAAAGMGLVLGGCAVIENATVTEATKVVSERALKRWSHLIDGQWEKAYEFYSPASRSTLSPEAFRRRSAGGQWWRSIAVERVDCRPESCQVTMTLVYDLKDIKGLRRTIEETWINDAGTWWLVAGRK